MKRNFLVDTGAIDCLAPEEELEKIGIRKEGKSVYELANGEVVEYDLGFARIAFMGQETVSQVIFGPKGVEPRGSGPGKFGVCSGSGEQRVKKVTCKAIKRTVDSGCSKRKGKTL